MFNKVNKEQELANKLVNYSCKVKSGEKVLITYSDTSNSFIELTIKSVLIRINLNYKKSLTSNN